MAYKKPQDKKPTDWDLEASFSETTLEELINLAPFKEASDSKGGSFTEAARVPNWLDRKIVRLVEMRGSPYGVKSDVTRDALYLGLRVLSMRYKEDPDWSVESRLAKVVDDANMLSRIQLRSGQFETAIRKFWDSGDEEKAVEYMETYVATVVEYNDEYQRDKYLQFIRDNMFLRGIVDKCNIETRNVVHKRKEKK